MGLKRKISHYELLELVATGSFGRVYRAYDSFADRTVAIKSLRAVASAERDARVRFLREAQAIAKIDHANVVTLYDVVQVGDDAHLVMQWINGSTLKHRIKQGSISRSEATRIAGEIADGLAEAHRVGVVHRDLKPENVLVDESGQCKIVDFGLAHTAEKTTLRNQGGIVGTPAYMSPEQRQGKEVDGKTDVYSLGLILQQMLLESGPTPKRMRELIAKATDPSPDTRPSASEFKRELERRPLLPARMLALVVVVAGLALWPQIKNLVDPRPTNDVHRILVAPFENVGDEGNISWLSTSIMDNLMLALGQIEGFRLVSRNAISSALVDRAPVEAGVLNQRLFQLAQRVEVDFLVSGNYLQTGNNLKINCELEDFRKQELLATWSTNVDHIERDLLASIDTLGTAIASALGVKQNPPPQLSRHTSDVLALTHFEEGMQHLQRADEPKASASFRAAVDADPEYARAWLYLWRTLPDRDERKEAITQAMQFRRGKPAPLGAIIEAAYADHKDDYAEAISRYSEILDTHTDQTQVRKWLGNLLLQQRKWLDAIGEFEVARRQSPFDYSFQSHLSMAHIEAGRTNDAHRLLLDWRQDAPGDVSALVALIQFSWTTGEFSRALAYCDTLAGLRPGADLGHRATVLRMLGRATEAEQALLSWMDVREGRYMRAAPLMMLADLDLERQRLQTGQMRILEALSIQDNYYSRWIAGKISVATGNLDDARTHAQAIATSIGDDPEGATTNEAYTERRFYLDLMGRIALAAGDNKESVRLHELARRASGRLDAAAMRTPLGRAYLAAADTASALQAFDQALSLNHNYYEPLLELGRIDLARGDIQAARTHLDQLASVWAAADADFIPNQELAELRAQLDR